ncbi:MAG: AAA family ATPase, partial [Desulfobacteraceae bacterium]
MNLSDFNPWWKDGSVPAHAVGRKRKIFNEVLPYLETRQILLITGLRRVGKTTLMHQLIEHVLTHGTDRYHVLYFSFDEIGQEPEAILKEFEFDILKRDLQGEEVFVFFDEIQKLNDWEAKIKLLYDRQPRMKLALSGIRDGMLILCEIKSSISRSDMYTFEKKTAFYEKRHHRKAARKLVISPMVDERALQAAQKLGIEVYT